MLASDNSVSYDEVRRRLAKIARSGEGNYMDVDALNLNTGAKVGQGGQIKFPGKLLCMKDLLDMLKAALPKNTWLFLRIQNKARGFFGCVIDEEVRFKS